MPDTGAPWNIPYVESSDLVSDWPADSLALANAIDAGLDAAYAGIGTNVVQTVKSDTFTTSSTTLVDVTGMSATITPTSATSKVLVIVSMHIGFGSGANGYGLNLLRDSTIVAQGDADGIRPRMTFGFGADNPASAVDRSMVHAGITLLDSPATTSATTYKVQAIIDVGPLHVNRSDDDRNDGSQIGQRTVSSITAIEVAA